MGAPEQCIILPADPLPPGKQRSGTQARPLIRQLGGQVSLAVLPQPEYYGKKLLCEVRGKHQCFILDFHM